MLRELLPDPAWCRHRAQRLRRAHPGLSDVELARVAVRQARRLSTVSGVASGFLANPLAMAPAAGVDMAAVLKIEAGLTGVIAATLAPESLDDPEAFATDILLGVLFPSAVSIALREVGIQAGKHASRMLIRKHVKSDVLKRITRGAARYLGIKLTQRTIATKTVPVIGAAIGGTWNWLDVRRVGKRAIAYYQGE